MALLRQRVNRISDDAVEAGTGKMWKDWFKVLDKAGARMMEHREIVTHLCRVYQMTPWWGQTLAVAYEQQRGMRVKHQRGGRLEVDRAMVIDAPVPAVWNAWHDPAALARWLPDGRFTITRSNPGKSLRLAWEDGSSVGVWFYEQQGKTRLSVAHGKLGETSDIDRMRVYWGAALDRLQDLVAKSI
jgi:hypothetical protein